MNTKHRTKRIQAAQTRVMYACPFFGPGVCKLPVEFDETVETACTDGERIKFGTAFCDKLTNAELVTVICHEVWHCLAGHLWRAPSNVDWDRWNQAADHETNTMLKQFSAVVLADLKRGFDPFPFPKPEEAYCADPQFNGMAVEVIYNRLASQKPPGGSGGAGKGKGGKVAPSGNSAPNSKAGAGSMPSFGQIEQPKPGAAGATQQSAKQLANDWTATLLQSARLAQGNVPASLQRLVDGIVKPKIDWMEILRSWLREHCADDWCWTEPSMEFEGSGFILPSLKSEKMGPVVFGSDWSGSTFGELVEKFHVEKVNCLEEMRPSKLVDIGFDTRVVWEKEYLPGDTIDKRIAGGGGTSFVKVLERCAELVPQPKCVVILTDLEGEFPKEVPPFPVVWCAYGTKAVAPFGETIHVE